MPKQARINGDITSGAWPMPTAASSSSRMTTRSGSRRCLPVLRNERRGLHRGRLHHWLQGPGHWQEQHAGLRHAAQSPAFHGRGDDGRSKSLPSTCFVLNCGVAGLDANDKSEAPGRAVCASNKTGPQGCLCQASALVPSRLPMPSERPGALCREAKPATATLPRPPIAALSPSRHQP